jgi:hypothetical protein
MGIIAITTGTNWDTFAPDMIVAATTGVFVGVVLLIAQAFTQSRKVRADSTFAWESFKPKLAGAARRSWNRSTENLLPAPAPILALEALATGEPLALWQSHMQKKPDRTLDLLIILVRLRAEYESAATNLEVAAHDDSEMFAAELDRSNLVCVVRARAFGFEDDLALNSGFLTDNDKARYSKAADVLIGQPYTKFALDRFQREMSRFWEAIDQFWKLLDLADAANARLQRR